MKSKKAPSSDGMRADYDLDYSKAIHGTYYGRATVGDR
jgi:hypothetical protein